MFAAYISATVSVFKAVVRKTMAISQRLDLRKPILVMTPQLQQAIKLLQLECELAEFVEDELSQNPMLERDHGDAPMREIRARHRIKSRRWQHPTMNSVVPFHVLAVGDNLPDGATRRSIWNMNVWDDAHPRDVADNVVSGFESVAPVGSGGRSDFSEELGDFEATLRRTFVARTPNGAAGAGHP